MISSLSRLVACLFFSVSLNSFGAITTISWSGALEEVVVDTGGGLYSGNVSGSQYSGFFRVSDDAQPLSIRDDGGVWYASNYGPNGSPGNTSSISNNDNTAMEMFGGAGPALLISDDRDCSTWVLFDPLWGCGAYSNVFNTSVEPGSPIDSWWLDSWQGQCEQDGADRMCSFFAIEFSSVGGDLFTDTSYQALPPFELDTTNPEYAATFWIYEANISPDNDWEFIHGAWGYLDNITVSQVPIPTTAWLFGSALAALLVVRRKNKSN